VCNDSRGDSEFDLEILLDVPHAEIDSTHCQRHCTADNVLDVPDSLADSQTHPFACAGINIGRLLIPSVTHCEDDVVAAAAAAAASHLSFSSGESNSLLAIDCDSLDLLLTVNPGSVSPDADAASGVCDGP
jgi:hypothetical protein